MKPEMKCLIQIYQKNRNEKKPGKFVFDELGYYHQFFDEEMTVKKFSEAHKFQKETKEKTNKTNL